MAREFHLRNSFSNKFWTIDNTGTEVVTTSGRFGAHPRDVVKTFASAEEAADWVERKCAAKLGKGYREGILADLPPWAPKDWSTTEMNIEAFWEIIETFDWKKTGDDEEVMRRARGALASMETPQIERFSDLLAGFLRELDTKEHCAHVYEDSDEDGSREAGDPISADDFLYSRCAVVANGRAYYERALADPSHMPQDVEFESLLELAADAYEQKTGREYDYVSPIDYESFSNAEGWGQVHNS